MAQFDVRDVIYYTKGWLAIITFYAKGTSWYLGVPCFRSQIEASLAGQKMLGML